MKAFAVGAANALSEDWNIPDATSVDGLPPANSTQKSRWISAGFTSQKIMDAACPAAPDQSGLIDAAVAAFPNQVVVMSFNSGGWNIDNPSHETDQQWMPAELRLHRHGDTGWRSESQAAKANADRIPNTLAVSFLH